MRTFWSSNKLKNVNKMLILLSVIEKKYFCQKFIENVHDNITINRFKIVQILNHVLQNELITYVLYHKIFKINEQSMNGLINL